MMLASSLDGPCWDRAGAAIHDVLGLIINHPERHARWDGPRTCITTRWVPGRAIYHYETCRGDQCCSFYLTPEQLLAVPDPAVYAPAIAAYLDAALRAGAFVSAPPEEA